MGHAMHVFAFPVKADRAEMQRCADEFCQCNCDPWEHGGDATGVTAEPVQVRSDLAIFPDFDAAVDFLYSSKRPAYRTWAVRYRSEGEPSKRTEKLAERAARLSAELDALEDSALPCKRKSAYIGCAECGSKISREHLKRAWRCPVCGADLRSKTDRERIEAKRAARAKAERDLRESRAKDGEKAPVMWAMVAEVHC